MMKKNTLNKNALAAIALTLALALSACGNGAAETKSAEAAEQKTDSAAAEPAAAAGQSNESAASAEEQRGSLTPDGPGRRGPVGKFMKRRNAEWQRHLRPQ